MLRVALIAALAVLAAAAPAQAGWKTNRALMVAEAVWRPACGELHVAYGDPVSAGTSVDAGAWAWEGDCTIWINTDRHYAYFEEFCTIVLHEAGHVAGLGHSSNPRSVMYADPLIARTTARIGHRTVTRWMGADRRCLHRGRPYLERRGVLQER